MAPKQSRGAKAAAVAQRTVQAPRPYLMSFGEGPDAAHDDLRGMPQSIRQEDADGNVEYLPPPESEFLNFLEANPLICGRLAVSDPNIFFANGAICARLARREREHVGGDAPATPAATAAAPAATAPAAAPASVPPVAKALPGATDADASARATPAADGPDDADMPDPTPDAPAEAVAVLACGTIPAVHSIPAASGPLSDAPTADASAGATPAAGPPGSTPADPSPPTVVVPLETPPAPPANGSDAEASATDAPATDAPVAAPAADAPAAAPAPAAAHPAVAVAAATVGDPAPPASADAPADAGHAAPAPTAAAPAATIAAAALAPAAATAAAHGWEAHPVWFGTLLRVKVRDGPDEAFTGALVCRVEPPLLVCDNGEWITFDSLNDILESTRKGDIQEWAGGGLVAGASGPDAAVTVTYTPKFGGANEAVAGALIGQRPSIFGCNFAFKAHYLAMPTFCEPPPALGQRQLRGGATRTGRNRLEFATFRCGDILEKNMEVMEGGALDHEAVVACVVYVPAGAVPTDKQCRKLLLLCETKMQPYRFFVSQWGHWKRVAQPGVASTIDKDCHDFPALNVGENVVAKIEEVSWPPPTRVFCPCCRCRHPLPLPAAGTATWPPPPPATVTHGCQLPPF